MRYLPFLFLLACAHSPKTTPVEREEDLVSLPVALDQAQMSYLRGCVEAYQTVGVKISFPDCRDRAVAHRQELDKFMKQEMTKDAAPN